jgi:hypothetical protein
MSTQTHRHVCAREMLGRLRGDVTGDVSGKWWLVEQSLTKVRVVPIEVVVIVAGGQCTAAKINVQISDACGQAGK